MVFDTSKLTAGSWRTTVIGLISAAAGFVTFTPSLFAGQKYTWINELAKYIMIGGLAGLGITGKDSNVTGGVKPNPTNDPNAVAATAKNETL